MRRRHGHAAGARPSAARTAVRRARRRGRFTPRRRRLCGHRGRDLAKVGRRRDRVRRLVVVGRLPEPPKTKWTATPRVPARPRTGSRHGNVSSTYGLHLLHPAPCVCVCVCTRVCARVGEVYTHLSLSRSHSSMHVLWKWWLHGSRFTTSPSTYSPRQTTHCASSVGMSPVLNGWAGKAGRPQTAPRTHAVHDPSG